MDINNSNVQNQETTQTEGCQASGTTANDIKTINYKGQRHVIVNPGARWYLQTMDRCKNQYGVLQQEKYVNALLSVCLAPTMVIEDFGNDIKSLQQTVEQIERFLES